MSSPARPQPALIVHAGAWDVPPDERRAHRAGCLQAAQAGWDVLSGGGRALDAVQTAVMAMEDDPELNAGRGSVLTAAGRAELDAGLMDGGRLDIGAVAGVTDLANPILAAAAVLASAEVLLVGNGASAFARAQGIPTCDPGLLVVDRERRRLAALEGTGAEAAPADTVGAVAFDRDGHVAAGSSTGGRPGQVPGRVGDAPVPGSGFFADDAAGAACCTGRGEDILRAGLARRAVDLAREHTAQDACWLAIQELTLRIDGQAGVVLVGRDGSIGFAFNTPAMPVAYMSEDLPAPVVGGIQVA